MGKKKEMNMMAFKCNQYNTIERPQDAGSSFSNFDTLLVLLLFWTSDDF